MLGAGKAALFTALAERMYRLQILESGRYVVLADENRINLQLLAPQRGRILDRFGAALAYNHQNYRLVVIAEQAGDITATLYALGGLIEIGEGDRRRVLRDIRRKHPFVPVVVRGNLSWDEMARIEVAIPELPGVAIEQGLTRSYPLGETAAHAIGYVAAVSEAELSGDPLLELPDFRIGKSSIEKSQDTELRGSAGTSQVEVNAFGRVVRELARVPGRPGKDVVSCLDAAMQDFLARRCSTEESVASVLIDAVTGDVLALVSSPSFDPAPFAIGLTPAVWQQLSTDPRNPLTNKAIAGVYPPPRFTAGGSTDTAPFACARQSRDPATSFSMRPRGDSESTASRRWRAASAMGACSVSTFRASVPGSSPAASGSSRPRGAPGRRARR